MSRALDCLAAYLARRFLALYARTGVAEKAAFRIDLVDAGGKPIAIYTDVDAPQFAMRQPTSTDGNGASPIIPADAIPPGSAAP